MSNLQTRIDRLTSQITAIDNEIAQIEGATIGATAVQACCDERKQRLERRKTQLTSRKTNLESLQSSAFTTDEQNTVDAINTLFNNEYASHLNGLKGSSRKDEFFTTYALADTDFLKETVIKAFFRIN